MMANIYKGKVIKIISRTPSVKSFRFTRDPNVFFFPGQFLHLIFDPEHLDNKELNKYLSFSSSPDNQYIEVTKRMTTSIFCQKLSELKEGTDLYWKGPMGKCVYRDEYKKIGFLIGGIGITPVISILEYIILRKLKVDCVLLYSNRNEEDIAFKHELSQWKNNCSQLNLNVVFTLTECNPQDSDCIYGEINSTLMQKITSDWHERVTYIFGRPAMVREMRRVCEERYLRRELIKTEQFIGY